MNDWPEIAEAISQKFNVFIIPVSSKSKPAIKWKNFEEDDPDTQKPSKDINIFNQWAKRFSSYAVIAGPNLLIVDIDVKPGQNGKASLKYMREKGLPVDTFAVKSPSGGLHLYYNKPIHYTPKQGANLKVLFTDEDDRQGWEEIQIGFDSTGVDIRHGGGYVLGPGSIVEGKGEYKLIQDSELMDIPINIQIGRSGSVNVKNVTIEKDNPKTFGLPIGKGYRDQEILAFTMDLARRSLPDDFVEILIKARLRDCDNTDGEAPDYDSAWDKYKRATDKVDDIIEEMVLNKIYISTNQKVIDNESGRVVKLEDLKKELENRFVTIEHTSNNGETKTKRMNPCDLWMKDVDRQTVVDTIFDPRFDNGVVRCCSQDGYMDGNYYNTFVRIDRSEKPYTLVGEKIFEACLRVLSNVMSSKEDYDWFIKWLGMSILEPSFRPAWHFHIFGTVRGSGKTTLTKIVRALCGESNCRDLDVGSLDKDFNSELFSCSMGFLNDFTKVSNNLHDKVNTAFKRITGTDGYTRQNKYAESVQSPIFIRFIMTSNAGNDFPVDEGDRRLYKSESKGVKLDHETLILAHGIIGIHGSSQAEKDSINVDIQQKDVDYARYKMYSYLSNCGYLEMKHNRDCPHNAIKEEYIGLTRISYLPKFEQFIDHKSFVFASDIQTVQTIQLFLDKIKISTKVDTVISELLSRNILRKVPIVYKDNIHTQQVSMSLVSYDEDMDMITPMGGSTRKYICYTVRNFDHWMNSGIRRTVKSEISKIIGLRNLSTHNFNLSTEKVVNLIPE